MYSKIKLNPLPLGRGFFISRIEVKNVKEKIIKILIIIVLIILMPVLLYFSIQALWRHPIIMAFGLSISMIEYKYGRGPTDPRPFSVSIYLVILVTCHLI